MLLKKTREVVGWRNSQDDRGVINLKPGVGAYVTSLLWRPTITEATLQTRSLRVQSGSAIRLERH